MAWEHPITNTTTLSRRLTPRKHSLSLGSNSTGTKRRAGRCDNTAHHPSPAFYH
jgi:hypothetical protein